MPKSVGILALLLLTSCGAFTTAPKPETSRACAVVVADTVGPYVVTFAQYRTCPDSVRPR